MVLEQWRHTQILRLGLRHFATVNYAKRGPGRPEFQYVVTSGAKLVQLLRRKN
jgi:hypothetical protein